MNDLGAREEVVLVDEDGRSLGTFAKAEVHHAQTPLHLAFSVYLFDPDGRFLLTRRALDKATFPGVWTNSCCGHPAPGESAEDAVRRRAQDELGVTPQDLRLVLPAFRYRAEMDGVVENELCPLLVGTVPDPAGVRPDPTEVAEATWVEWSGFRDQVLSGAREVSHWCTLQVTELAALGNDPGEWPTGDPAALPEVLRPR